MNASELTAWHALVQLGAREIELGGKCALDLSPVRVRSARANRQYLIAVVEVVGRSGANRRHVDRFGAPVFVVTDDRRVRWTG